VRVGTSAWKWEKEEMGAWHGGRQCGAAGSGPWPLGAGEAVVARIGDGSGAWVTRRDATDKRGWASRGLGVSGGVREGERPGNTVSSGAIPNSV
jgi:hypothetical protein